MRWFKHMSDASDDPFIRVLEHQFGVAGYAWYWKTLELFARHGSVGDATYTVEMNSTDLLKLYRSKLSTVVDFLLTCEKHAKFRVYFSTSPCGQFRRLTVNGASTVRQRTVDGRLTHERRNVIFKMACPKFAEMADTYTKRVHRVRTKCEHVDAQSVRQEIDTEVEKDYNAGRNVENRERAVGKMVNGLTYTMRMR